VNLKNLSIKRKLVLITMLTSSVALVLLSASFLIYDLVSLHRIHRATMWAAPLTFAINAAAVPIGMTAAWHSFAAMLK